MPGGGTWFSIGLAALQVESGGHLDHLIFTSGSDVLQVKPKLSKWELRWLCHGANQVTESVTWFQIIAQIPILRIWAWAIRRYGILVLPKMGSTTLLYKSKRGWGTWQSLSSSSKRSMKSGKWQKLSVARVSLRFALAVVFLPTGIAAISGICPNR